MNPVPLPTGEPLPIWLDRARALVVDSDPEAASALLTAAVEQFPASREVRYALAGVRWQLKDFDAADSLLAALIDESPDPVAATFMRARIFKEQARMGAVESTLRPLFARAGRDVDTVIDAIELLDDCGRKQAASDIAGAAIGAGSDDPRLRAYAAMLHLQLGDFDRAAECYAAALAGAAEALEWECAYGLASSRRYADPGDADLASFAAWLAKPGLTTRARASLLFALGKAHDDLADYAQAAVYFREANALVAQQKAWSRKHWRRSVEARLNAKALPACGSIGGYGRPVFIVGVPRSGSTLVAEILSRHPDVRNRGELQLLPDLARRLSSSSPSRPTLVSAAADMLSRLRQDDAPALWYLDKQPFNFLHLDLIAALFPDAKVIHCQRNDRDTALSSWIHHFAGWEGDFSYDFGNIAAVTSDCRRLLRRAATQSALDIHTVRYEEMAMSPAASVRALSDWLELTPMDLLAIPAGRRVISTASAWQARQPVTAQSVDRWRLYENAVPELARFSISR